MTNFNASAALQAPSAPATTTGTSQSTFRPVGNAPEIQSGERLLVEAYAAIWIILFALILLGWRRQRRIDARITGLEAALSQARRAASAKKAEAS